MGKRGFGVAILFEARVKKMVEISIGSQKRFDIVNKDSKTECHFWSRAEVQRRRILGVLGTRRKGGGGLGGEVVRYFQ